MDRVKAPFDWNDLFMHLEEELSDPEVSYILSPRPPFAQGSQSTPCFVVVDSLRSAPYRIRGSRVYLSGHRLQELARTVGLDTWDYLRLFGLVAYVKWKTLALNPRMREYDLCHSESVGCIFESPAGLEGYLRQASRPKICGACESLYQTMGAELALAELRACLSRA